MEGLLSMGPTPSSLNTSQGKFAHFRRAPPPPQKCAKTSKGPPLRTFCTFPRRGGAPPPDFVQTLHGSGGGGGERGALTRTEPKLLITPNLSKLVQIT